MKRSRLIGLFAGALLVSCVCAEGRQAAPPPPSPPPLQHVEYILVPTCVDSIVVNTKKWHCVVDNPDNPTQVVCDPDSMTVLFKKTIKIRDCVEVHIVMEKK